MDSYAKVTRENHRGLPGVDQSSKASKYNFNSFYIGKIDHFWTPKPWKMKVLNPNNMG